MEPLKPRRKNSYDLDAAPENYLELWKWFSEDMAKIKDKMWTMAAFFYTILGALLGFIAKGVVGTHPLKLESPTVLLFASLTGLLLSGYGMYMLWEYGRHIRTGWDRTNYLRTKIKGLTPIWYAGDVERIEEEKTDLEQVKTGKAKKKKIYMPVPPFAIRLIGLLGLFLLVFMGALVLIVR